MARVEQLAALEDARPARLDHVDPGVDAALDDADVEQPVEMRRDPLGLGTMVASAGVDEHQRPRRHPRQRCDRVQRLAQHRPASRLGADHRGDPGLTSGRAHS
jgi:hypothetical protein